MACHGEPRRTTRAKASTLCITAMHIVQATAPWFDGAHHDTPFLIVTIHNTY
jgi:hypothetical protein